MNIYKNILPFLSLQDQCNLILFLRKEDCTIKLQPHHICTSTLQKYPSISTEFIYSLRVNQNSQTILHLYNLSNLTILNCSSNPISFLPSTLPPTLTILDCSYTNLTVLSELPSTLTTLFCQGSPIQKLSVNQNLLFLDCSDTQITQIPELPPRLQTLTCNNTNIYEILHLPNKLRTLSCSHTKITNLHNLPDSLRNLDCSYTNISVLPNVSAFLRWLNCSHTKISHFYTLPESLRRLDCSHTNISHLNNLPDNLTELICEFTTLRELKNLPYSLTRLKCNDCPIHNLDLQSVLSLTSLDCDRTFLQSIDCIQDLLEFNFEETNLFLETLPQNLLILNHKIIADE